MLAAMASEDGSPLPEGKGAGGEGPWAGLAIIIGASASARVVLCQRDRRGNNSRTPTQQSKEI